MKRVDVAVFAHNEEHTISDLIEDLSRQSILFDAGAIVRIRILANGCADNTVSVARSGLTGRKHLNDVTVVDELHEAGKALTWNRFVTELPSDSQYVVFLDGDIRIEEEQALLRLITGLVESDATAITSRPKKSFAHLRCRPILKLAAHHISRQHQDGPIAGSLYAARTEAIRDIRLPVPCLVEDGFLSACLITDLFAHKPTPRLVKASQNVSHTFEAPSTLMEFFRHDVRLQLGVELNAALYTALWAADSQQERREILQRYARSEDIDSSIDDHLMHPERTSLFHSWKPRFNNGEQSHTDIRTLLRWPVHSAHALYLSIVRAKARRLFKQRQFNW